jgi:flagellar hook-basal body complex protein FliE
MMGSPLPGILPLSQVSPGVETGKPRNEGSDFYSQLQTAFNQVEQLQTEADQQIAGLLNGQGEDIHRAMIAVEKANLSFQLMMQVRNKIVQAYRDVSGTVF